MSNHDQIKMPVIHTTNDGGNAWFWAWHNTTNGMMHADLDAAIYSATCTLTQVEKDKCGNALYRVGGYTPDGEYVLKIIERKRVWLS